MGSKQYQTSIHSLQPKYLKITVAVAGGSTGRQEVAKRTAEKLTAMRRCKGLIKRHTGEGRAHRLGEVTLVKEGHTAEGRTHC